MCTAAERYQSTNALTNCNKCSCCCLWPVLFRLLVHSAATSKRKQLVQVGDLHRVAGGACENRWPFSKQQETLSCRNAAGAQDKLLRMSGLWVTFPERVLKVRPTNLLAVINTSANSRTMRATGILRVTWKEGILKYSVSKYGWK